MKRSSIQTLLIAWAAILAACVLHLNCSKPDIELPNYAVVPIVFHIVHDGEPVGTESNISEVEVSRELEKINRQFSDLYVQFRLAVTNPEGTDLIEPGINRVQREEQEYTFSQAWSYAYKIFWDPKEYLNVFVIDVENSVDGENVIGQGRYPHTINEDPLPGLTISYFPDYPIGYADGIIIDSYYFTSNSIAVHELGHFFGLRHTFKDECDTIDADYCDDTPLYSRDDYNNDSKYSNVKAKRLSCDGIPFLADNYMDYYYNYRSTFTADQRKRVQHVISNSPRRKELIGSKQLPVELQDTITNKAGMIDAIPEIVN